MNYFNRKDFESQKMSIEDFIAEETKGVQDYQAAIDAATDLRTKEVLTDIMEQEKRHIEMLQGLSGSAQMQNSLISRHDRRDAGNARYGGKK